MDYHLSETEIAALKREILSSLCCAMPGIVVSFDAERGTAAIQPANSRLPVLQDVPVYLPEDREIPPGALALVVFADFDTEAFLETGQAGLPPSGRAHSLSDAFAFVGFGVSS